MGIPWNPVGWTRWCTTQLHEVPMRTSRFFMVSYWLPWGSNKTFCKGWMREHRLAIHWTHDRSFWRQVIWGTDCSGTINVKYLSGENAAPRSSLFLQPPLPAPRSAPAPSFSATPATCSAQLHLTFGPLRSHALSSTPSYCSDKTPYSAAVLFVC